MTLCLADAENERILKETLSSGTYTETTVPTSVSGPFGVAVDGQGDIYISDENGSTGAMRILKETPSGETYVESVLQTSRLNVPFGIATDNRGDVYVADSGNNRILKEDFADPPSLSFASTAVGTASSDSPQVVTIENVGNATLNFATLASGTNPSMTGNFTLESSQESLCPVVSAGSSASGTLFAGHSCVLPISFAPTGTGTINGSLTLTDNALNAPAPGFAIQSIALSGVGTGNTAQTINFSALPNVTYGVSPITLTATTSSGLPVSYTVSGPATVLGSTMTITGAGSVTVTTWQPGNDNYAAAASVSHSFTVAKAALTITASNVNVAYNQPIPVLSGYTATGFVNGDTQSVLSGAPSEFTMATQGSPAGTYPITVTQETLAAANYSFTFVNGTLTITNGSTVINFVQIASATPQGTAATVSASYQSPQTSGDLNVVVVGWSDTTSSVQSVTDSAGNAYRLAIGPTIGDGLQQAIYYAPNIVAGANTVTVTFDQAAGYPDIRIVEYRGISNVDVTAGASGNSTSASSGVATTASADELIFGAETVGAFTLEAGSGFTARIITSPDSDLVEDETVSTAGNYSATATLEFASPWVMQMVTFK
jgi:MBG domain-containing protein/NHL repeat-containing protein